jgi:homoserine O-acetyltransferase
LYITKALDYFDLSNGIHSLAAAFANSTSPLYLVVSFTSDWLYPAYHSKELVSSLTAAGADVTYVNIQSTWGHDAFLLEVDTMTGLLTNFLGRVAEQFHIILPPPPTPEELAALSLPEAVELNANQADMMA